MFPSIALELMQEKKIRTNNKNPFSQRLDIRISSCERHTLMMNFLNNEIFQRRNMSLFLLLLVLLLFFDRKLLMMNSRCFIVEMKHTKKKEK